MRPEKATVYIAPGGRQMRLDLERRLLEVGEVGDADEFLATRRKIARALGGSLGDDSLHVSGL